MANLKYFNNTTGLWEEIKVSTKFKDLYNTTKLTQDQNYANIGITGFNPNEDVLFSIWNSTWLQKDQDYIINGGLLRIESKDGSNWSNGDTFNFIALKNVDKNALPSADGSLIQDGSITIAKLATSIQEYITNITNHLADLITDTDGAHGFKIEEGIFTPFIMGDTVAGSNTYSVQNGYYKKIGSICYVWIWLTLTAKDANMSGIVSVGGLPFSPKGRTNQRNTFSFAAMGNITFPSGCTALVSQTVATSPKIYLGAYGNVASSDLNQTCISNNTVIILSGSYEV